MNLLGKPEPPDPEEDRVLSAAAADMAPTSEPKLTQLDPESREILLNLMYEHGFVRDEAMGGVTRVATGCNYPEIEGALAYAASHLNSVMNYTWEHGQAMVMFFEGLFYDPLSLFYEDDSKALRVLDTLHQMLMRGILGGSVGGSHQAYNVKMAGGFRTVETRRGEPR